MSDFTFGSIKAAAKIGVLLILFGFSQAMTAGTAAAYSECLLFTGTADGIVKDPAVEDSRETLEESIDEWKSKNPGANISRSAQRPKPNPYWRDAVSDDLYYKPDIVDSKAYTVCWHGVVSPVVCTSGAKVCH